MSTEHPILMKGWCVRANHAGQKHVTRRLSGLKKINEDPDAWEINEEGWQDGSWYTVFQRRSEPRTMMAVWSPFGGPGDTIWTRETWSPWADEATKRAMASEDKAIYRADYADTVKPSAVGGDWVWKPSIHMPRWASRDSYVNISVRCERLHEITDEDARAEGVNAISLNKRDDGHGLYYSAFADAWDEINADRGYPWEKNPFVWRVEYLNPVAVGKGEQKEVKDD